jgi:hypothetical protein
VGAKEWVFANMLEDREILEVWAVPKVCDDGEVRREGIEGTRDKAEGEPGGFGKIECYLEKDFSREVEPGFLFAIAGFAVWITGGSRAL